MWESKSANRHSVFRYRRVALLSRPPTPSSTRKVEEVFSYAVASVFTPVEKRGRGFASHMMKLLHWVLAPRHTLPKKFPPLWGSPPKAPEWAGNAQFSVLYSDIGPRFYFHCGPDGGKTGWKVTGATHTIWDVASIQGVAQTFSQPNLEWLWLSTEQCITLWASDLPLVHRDLQNIASKVALAFAFQPSDGTSIWNVYKTMCFTHELKPYLPSDTWGVLLTRGATSGTEPPTFATWIYDFRSNPRTLIVTRLRVTKSMFKPLFAKIHETALRQQIGRIEMWDLSDEFVAGPCSMRETGGQTLPRQDHLPAVKWYGDVDETKLDWMYNER